MRSSPQAILQRERIAAIQQRIDPRALSPIYDSGDAREEIGIQFEHAQLRRAQGLKIGGTISIATGLGIGIPLVLLGEPEGYIPGVLMILIGVSLLICSRFIVTNGRRGRGGDGSVGGAI